MKSSISIFLFFACIAISNAYAQDSKKDKELAKREAVKKLIEQQQFSFNAQSVTPINSKTRFLSGGYSLNIKRDAITCNLPYFGDINQPQLNPMDASLRFTTIEFEYSVETRKNGWDVSVVAKDIAYAPRLFISIYKNGSATLRYSSNDRQAITYDGHIEDLKF